MALTRIPEWYREQVDDLDLCDAAGGTCGRVAEYMAADQFTFYCAFHAGSGRNA